jgi:hypothetical protein
VPYWFDLKVYSNQTYALIPLWLALCVSLPLEACNFFAIRFHSEVFVFKITLLLLLKAYPICAFTFIIIIIHGSWSAFGFSCKPSKPKLAKSFFHLKIIPVSGC